MSHSQLKKGPNRWQRMLRLGLYSTFAHGIVLFAFLFLNFGDGSLRFDIHHTLIDADVPVIVVPWCKTVPTQYRGHPKVKKSASAKAAATKEVAQKTSAAKPEPVLAKDEKVTTIATSATGDKKAASKKVAKKKEDAKEIKIEKKEEIKETPKPEPVLAKEETTNPPASEKVAAANQPETVGNDDAPDALYIGRDEAALLEMQETLQQELCGRWRPPAGLRADLICEVTLSIDWDGSVKNVKVSKSSGVPIYDMSARQSLTGFAAPAWSKGKEITICFKQ